MKIFRFALIAMAMLTASDGVAQNNRGNATVVAQKYDISDNLDLQAVASIFGESRDLEDFERRINDPSAQISNLDLNNDNYVDYLRVVEVGESDVRVIVIQAVLGQDQFQDVATIELERQRNKTVHVQVVGNSYIYGPNYIYEPFYYSTPMFFDMFWLTTYRPYYSPWYWGYYPTYYSYWRPMPVFRYHSHIYSHINHRNRYSYTDNRRLVRADRMTSGVRGNSLERQNPNRSFASRNENATNRRALETTRDTSRSRNAMTGSNLRGSNGSESVGRVQNADSRTISSGRSNTINSGRQRVSSEEFSRSRASNATLRTNRSSIQNNGTLRSNSNSSTIRREAAPASSRIERSSRISSQPSRSFSQPSSSSSRSSAPTMSRSSSPSMSRSSAPSMSRSSGSMGGGSRSSSGGGMTRGGR